MKALLDAKAGSRTRATIPVAGGGAIHGELILPPSASGIVVFVHGSSASRNAVVARTLSDGGMGVLIMDLLTPEEEQEDEETGSLRFNVPLQAHRLATTVRWLEMQPEAEGLKIGLFGASMGGAAVLLGAAELGERISAIVLQGGRPDLAGDALMKISSPTILVVGALDDMVVRLNEEALPKFGGDPPVLRIVPGASHLFEEAGKIEQVAWISAQWFARHLTGDE